MRNEAPEMKIFAPYKIASTETNGNKITITTVGGVAENDARRLREAGWTVNKDRRVFEFEAIGGTGREPGNNEKDFLGE